MTTENIVYNAVMAARNGDFNGAIKGFTEYLAKNPRQVQIMGELCRCYFETGNYVELAKIASRALYISQCRNNSDNIGRFYNYLGKSHHERKLYRQAIKYFQLAAVNKPKFMPNYHEMAYCYYELKEYEKALESFKKIEREDENYAKEYEIDKKIEAIYEEWNSSSRVRYLSALGFTHLEQGNLELAKKEYTDAFRMEPSNPVVIYGLFSIAQKEGETGKAIELGEKLFGILDKSGNKKYGYLKPVVFLGLSNLYRGIGDYEKSAEYGQWFFTTECEKNAKAALNRFDFAEAIRQYSESLKARPDCTDALENLVKYLILKNRVKEAVIMVTNSLKSAVEMKKIDKASFYYFQAGFCAWAGEQYDVAVDYYQRALKESTDLDFQLKVNHGLYIVYKDSKQPQKALSALRSCEELTRKGATDVFDIPSLIIKQECIIDKNSDINRSNRHFNTGIALYNEKKFEAAIKEFETALNLIPQDLNVMNVLTRAYFIVGKQKEAANIAEEGIAVSNRDNDTRYIEIFAYNIGNYNYNIGNYEKALKYYNCALNRNPDDEDYKYFVSVCKKKLGIE